MTTTNPQTDTWPRCTHCSVPHYGVYSIGHDGLPHTIANQRSYALARQLVHNNAWRSLRVAHVRLHATTQGRRLLCAHCARHFMHCKQ